MIEWMIRMAHEHQGFFFVLHTVNMLWLGSEYDKWQKKRRRRLGIGVFLDE